MRLWRKLRKKLHTQLQPEIFQLKRRSAWEILFNLTCFSRAPFEEIKQLRSDRYVPDEIYSRIRLSNSSEEPGKTRARKALQSVCKHRNMSWPRSAMGLQLKFTADPNFGSEISRWIRRVLCHKHILIPCHLPVFKVREQPHQSLKDFLTISRTGTPGCRIIHWSMFHALATSISLCCQRRASPMAM